MKDEFRRATFILHPSSFILHPSSFILHPSSSHRPLPKEAQQVPIVRNGRGNDEPVDARVAEAAVDLLIAGGGAALDLGRGEREQSAAAGFGVDPVREAAAREA